MKREYRFPRDLQVGNILWKSKKPPYMPSKPLKLDHSRLETLNHYIQHDPKTAQIIRTVIDSENKRDDYWYNHRLFYITELPPQLLPSTEWENWFIIHKTAPASDFFNHIFKIIELMWKIAEFGYIKEYPIWLSVQYFTRDTPHRWMCMVNGGHHRLQAVRELMAGRESYITESAIETRLLEKWGGWKIPATFKIPTIISVWIRDLRHLPEFKKRGR